MPDTTVVETPVQQTIAPEIVQGMINAGIIPAPAKEEILVTTTETPVTPTDIFQPFKEKFGYEKPEDALLEIEQLRQFKANPPAPTYQFENPESEKLFRAWMGGKKSDVYNYLKQENEIETYLTKDINEESAADVVKLGMQLKYKDLTPAEINYTFNKKFALPVKPTQGTEEDDIQYTQRVNDWQQVVSDKKMDLLIEAKLARPELEAAKSKLVFPEIEQSADEGYLQYKKDLENNEKLAAEAQAFYKTLTPKAIETKLNFKDEANKIDFDYIYEPDAESFGKAIEMTADIDKFWNTFYNQDGSPNREKFLQTIYRGLNAEKMIMEGIKQGKNAAIKATLPDNTQGGLVRQITNLEQPQESELDKNMRLNGIKRAN